MSPKKRWTPKTCTYNNLKQTKSICWNDSFLICLAHLATWRSAAKQLDKRQLWSDELISFFVCLQIGWLWTTQCNLKKRMLCIKIYLLLNDHHWLCLQSKTRERRFLSFALICAANYFLEKLLCLKLKCYCENITFCIENAKSSWWILLQHADKTKWKRFVITLMAG